MSVLTPIERYIPCNRLLPTPITKRYLNTLAIIRPRGVLQPKRPRVLSSHVHYRLHPIHFINWSAWNVAPQRYAAVLSIIATMLFMRVLFTNGTYLCLCFFKVTVSTPSTCMLFNYHHISMFVFICLCVPWYCHVYCSLWTLHNTTRYWAKGGAQEQTTTARTLTRLLFLCSEARLGVDLLLHCRPASAKTLKMQ